MSKDKIDKFQVFKEVCIGKIIEIADIADRSDANDDYQRINDASTISDALLRINTKYALIIDVKEMASRSGYAIVLHTNVELCFVNLKLFTKLEGLPENIHAYSIAIERIMKDWRWAFFKRSGNSPIAKTFRIWLLRNASKRIDHAS